MKTKKNKNKENLNSYSFTIDNLIKFNEKLIIDLKNKKKKNCKNGKT